jgi:hypothetical protein
MRLKSLRVFTGILMFGLLLGASSTAYADAFSLTSFSFNNLQFTPSVGTAQFTVTGTTARADAGINGGVQISNSSSSFPIAQASAAMGPPVPSVPTLQPCSEIALVWPALSHRVS